MTSLTPSDIFDRQGAKLPAEIRCQIMQFLGRACAQQYRLPYALTQRYLPTPATVLDWGCGNGHFSYFLHEFGHRVEAYAFGAPAPLVQYLLDHTNGHFRYTTGSSTEPVRIPYADQSFDAVFSIGVLEHVRECGGEEARSLAEIHRILKPGGLFLCFHFPNRYSWIEVLTSIFRSRHHHKYKYTKADIRAMMGNAGFKIESLRRYNAFPRNIFSSLPFLRRTRWLARMIDAMDSFLGIVLNPFCQNYAVIARRGER